MGDTSLLSNADRYEERIRQLLKNLGCKKVFGGKDFLIGDNQIDALGIFEDKILIVECTTQSKDLRSKLENWKGKVGSIRRALGEHSIFNKYNKGKLVRFILASRYSAAESYQELASGEPKVYIWGPRLVFYYEKIAKAIPSRAIYDIFSDLDLKIEAEMGITVPAFKVTINNINMFNFFISPHDLIKISYVARRETGRKDFYQRMIDPSRLNKINYFLKKGGIFPTNIVVGINSSFSFKSISIPRESLATTKDWFTLGLLTLPVSYQGCWIIDGQHRLYSFDEGMRQKVAVLAFSNIDLAHQTQFFIEINKNAKPISSMLLWDLEGDLRPQSKEGILSNAVKKLNQATPFKGIISIPSLGTGKISISTLCNSLLKSDFSSKEIKTGKAKYFVRNPFFHNNHIKFAENISNSIAFYFDKMTNDLSEEKYYIKNFIFDNGGVSVLIYIYKIIICIEGKKIDSSLVPKYVKPLIDYLSSLGVTQIKDYKRKCSSEGGKKLVLNDLLKTLEEVNSEIADYIDEKYMLTDELTDLELKLRKVIAFEFNRIGLRDVKKILKPQILISIEKRIGQQYDIPALCNEFSLDNETKIITWELWNKIFREIFTRGEEKSIDMNDPRFLDEELFKITLSNAVEARNNLIHKKEYSYSRRDKEMLHNFIEQTNSIISKHYGI